MKSQVYSLLISSAIMNNADWFSAHLWRFQKPRRRQNPIVAILLSERPIVTIFLSERSNDAFKSYLCDRTCLGQFWSDQIFVMVCAKGLTTLLQYCSKGKWRISQCKQIATHNVQLKLVLLDYDVTVFVLILL